MLLLHAVHMHVFGQCLTQDVRGTILDMICWSFDALGRLSYESMFLCVLYWKKHASFNFYMYIYIESSSTRFFVVAAN